MTDDVPERAVRAFTTHDAFEEREGHFAVTTTRFDASVTAENTDEPGFRYRVRVTVPTLSTAVAGSVAEVVEEGWLDTFRLRLEDAAMAVPGDATITTPETRTDGEHVVIETIFRERNAERASRTAKALVDYVEGTYAEGIVPGYEYRPPVSDLLAAASHSDDPDPDPDSDVGTGGPMPM